MSYRLKLIALCVVAAIASLAACSSAAADEWGTLKGKFVLDGKAPAPRDIGAAKLNVDCGKYQVPAGVSLILAQRGFDRRDPGGIWSMGRVIEG